MGSITDDVVTSLIASHHNWDVIYIQVYDHALGAASKDFGLVKNFLTTK
jgi:ABC-type sugar transport system substrate-binding protein